MCVCIKTQQSEHIFSHIYYVCETALRSSHVYNSNYLYFQRAKFQVRIINDVAEQKIIKFKE